MTLQSPQSANKHHRVRDQLYWIRRREKGRHWRPAALQHWSSRERRKGGDEWKPSLQILRHYVLHLPPADPVTAHNLSHQSPFLRSRCFPMSTARPPHPLLRPPPPPSPFSSVAHESLGLLSFPALCHTTNRGVSWDAVLWPNLLVGKHILIDGGGVTQMWK